MEKEIGKDVINKVLAETPQEVIDAEIKEMKRQYNREWYAKNKEKVRAINRRSMERRAAAIIARRQMEQNDEHKD